MFKKVNNAKLKHSLDEETLRQFAARGLTIPDIASEYGVTTTHFRRLIQDRVSLQKGLQEGKQLWQNQDTETRSITLTK